MFISWNIVLNLFINLIKNKPRALIAKSVVEEHVRDRNRSGFFDRPVNPFETPVKFSFHAAKRSLSTNRNLHIYFFMKVVFCSDFTLYIIEHCFRRLTINNLLFYWDFRDTLCRKSICFFRHIYEFVNKNKKTL